MTNKAKDTKEQVLRAAIEEFGQKGYLAASTNKIAKQAGVSKGIIFHYFDNKRNLYTACIRFGLDEFTSYILDSDFTKEKDIFDRIFYLGRRKVFLYEKHDHLGKLLIAAYESAVSGNDPELKVFFDQAIKDSISQFMIDLDTTAFADDLDEQEVILYIITAVKNASTTILNSYQNNYQEMISQLDTIYEQLERVVRMIKYGVYKQTGHSAKG